MNVINDYSAGLLVTMVGMLQLVYVNPVHVRDEAIRLNKR